MYLIDILSEDTHKLFYENVVHVFLAKNPDFSFFKASFVTFQSWKRLLI